MRGAFLSLAALALASAAAPAQAAPPADRRAMVVERVVMLMRHGVRPSTKFPATPAGTTKDPWPVWTTPAGELTEHGAQAVRRVAAWDRALFVDLGLIPAKGCAGPGAISAMASGSSRAIRTGEAFLDTLQPGCAVPLDHPASEDAPDAFHPDAAGLGIDSALALQAAERALPAGGLDAEVKAFAPEFALLERIVGVPVKRASDLKPAPGDLPDLKGGLSFGSTVGQTILLEYLEGMPMREVGWGRAQPADIRRLLRFHPVKFRIETRVPYAAQRIAAPLVTQMIDALAGALAGKGSKLTLLFGHDTNIAALGGFYDLHWTMADYPRDDIAPGGALGFELLRDNAGHRFVRAFVRAQTMAQVRDLTVLGKAARPSRITITIPGCDTAQSACPLETFEALTRDRLAHPAAP